MPTVLHVGPYRFFFFAKDGEEPPHIHVERDDDNAKFWLSPVRSASNNGFRPHEFRKIEQIVIEHEEAFLERWNEFFNL
jgi:hypothetical protein